MKPLNLASRPFRNERLPRALLGLASVLLLALTLWHVRAIVQLLPRSTTKLAQDVRSLEEEGRRLRAEASRMRSTKPSPADAARWSMIKELVDQRVFSWTRLFAVLEESLPKGVRLMSVTPRAEKGQFSIDLMAMARSVEDGFSMIDALEQRPEFENVRPESRGSLSEQGISFQYLMVYNPAALPPQPSPPPEAEAEDTPGPEASPEAGAPTEPRP